MSIEETLDRLATNVALLTGAVATLAESVNGAYAGKQIYSGKEDVVVSLPAEGPKAAEPAKPVRGRPPKVTAAAEKAAATPAEVVEKVAEKAVETETRDAAPLGADDDFLNEPTAASEKELTSEDVKAALQAYAKANNAKGEGNKLARAKLTEVTGFDNLTTLPKSAYAKAIKAVKV